MDNLLYTTICSPFCFTASVLNIFFLFCLRRPAVGVTLRQPLRFLLFAVLCNSTIQQCTVSLTIVLCFFAPPHWLLTTARCLTYQTFCANFASNAWISIFYYLKVVPHKRAAVIWIRRNIKPLTYCGYFLELTVLCCSMCLAGASFLLPPPPQQPSNSSAAGLNGTPAAHGDFAAFLYSLSTKMFFLYGAFPLCALSFSWGMTFIYLQGHMKRMEQSASPFSHPQHRNQMRVTVMGIVQTALFIPSSVWSLSTSVLYSSNLYDALDGNKHITLTITSVSGLGNIVCLGISQSVFRIRVAAVWSRLRKAIGMQEHPEQPET
ncbi:hypothetical protein NFI96_008366 [Prochilodus magdalenae]|nr:hypothetical protein NFI96_008366 [Prochilodus magdalenae]